MNVCKPVREKTIEEYFSQLPAERREPLEFLHKLSGETTPVPRVVW